MLAFTTRSTEETEPSHAEFVGLGTDVDVALVLCTPRTPPLRRVASEQMERLFRAEQRMIARPAHVPIHVTVAGGRGSVHER